MPRPVPKTPSRRAPPASKRRRPKARRSPRPSHATRKQRLTRAAKAAIATTGVIVTGAIAAGAVHQHRSRRVRELALLLGKQDGSDIPESVRSPSGWRSVIDVLNRVRIPNDTNRTRFKKQCLAQRGLFVSAYNSMRKLLESEHDKNTATIGTDELTLVRLFILKQTIFNTIAIDTLEEFVDIYNDDNNISDKYEICAWAMALEHLKNERLRREVDGIEITRLHSVV